MMRSISLYKGKQISFYVARDFFTKNNFAPQKQLHTPAKAILNESSAGGHRGDGRGAPPPPRGRIGVSGPGPDGLQGGCGRCGRPAEACKGRDAAIGAYNPGWANPRIHEETLRNYPP